MPPAANGDFTNESNGNADGMAMGRRNRLLCDGRKKQDEAGGESRHKLNPNIPLLPTNPPILPFVQLN